MTNYPDCRRSAMIPANSRKSSRRVRAEIKSGSMHAFAPRECDFCSAKNLIRRIEIAIRRSGIRSERTKQDCQTDLGMVFENFEYFLCERRLHRIKFSTHVRETCFWAANTRIVRNPRHPR